MTAEPKLSENALRTLRGRYLWKDASGKIVETPRELLTRVARAVASAESSYGASSRDVERTAQEFYRIMAEGIFLPNSPTLMNAGRALGVLSACFVLPIEDSIDGIFESVKHTAQIQKAGGGTGFSFDRLRPAGDYIASSGGRTSGPISFWRVFCEATRAIQQGAFRRGANMGMMSIDHPDILKFITAKDDPSAFENFNISVKVSDAFMDALRTDPDGTHVVRNFRTGRAYYLPRGLDLARYRIQDLVPGDAPPPPDVFTRRELWNLIVTSAWETGEPGLCFIDRVNEGNPTPELGRIEATNPCGEQPLLDYEACNLGSIDISKFVRHRRLDEDRFRKMVRLGLRFLDDVIDANNYIIPPIEQRCLGNRKIGLGIMGFADALLELGIKYDSEEGLTFGRRVAAMFTEEAFAASEELAKARGHFPNWSGSTWDVRLGRPMRNAAITTVAPTGTLSILAGCSGGIEPLFSLAFYRHVLGGEEMLEVNAPFKRRAQREGFWSDDVALKLARGGHLRDIPGVDAETIDVFVTAHDIAPPWHVRMQGAFQEYIDGAISKTINLPNSATASDVDEAFQLAYDLKCKGVTAYRDACRTGQPMAIERIAGTCPQCGGPLGEEGGCWRCPKCGSPLCSL
jgi:ribonucleoside-diphosphate reductase alpha chain